MAVGRKTGGRVAGVPNKLTVSVKEAILTALEDAGGAKYLAGVARENPQVFCALLGKLLPSEITGANGGPMLSVLIEGKQHSNPVRRTSAKGQAYVTAQMRAAGGDPPYVPLPPRWRA